jgi:cytidine deaminase
VTDQRGTRDPGELDRLREAAEQARRMHWAPYTRAEVVAAVRTIADTYHGGSNVEIANITLSKHAEESAVLSALAAGALEAPGRPFVVSAVYTTAPPCGSCRQFLLEFATEDCVVYIDGGDGAPDVCRLDELYPRAFGPQQQLAASAPDGE